MKVRTKFTLWIALTSAVSAVVFSQFVFHETKEEVAEFVDFGLNEIAELLFTELENAEQEGRTPRLQDVKYPIHRFWVRVGDGSGKVLYQTDLAGYVELPPVEEHKSSMVVVDISYENLWIPASEQQDIDELTGDKVKMRVRYFTRVISGEQFSILLGQPLLLVHAEFREALHELAVGICVTIILILIAAYLVTGRILKPLSSINEMIREIRETSLDKRIPLGKSKDELYALTASLNSMFDRLEHSFTLQRDFIGNAAHEMKSPLTILILGHEEMLSTDLPDDIRSELEKQLHSMQRLNKLIRDLLSIARLEQQDALVREQVDLSLLIQGVLEDYSEIIKEKEIKVVVDVPRLIVLADYEKLLRLFINLIDNGIKYNYDHDGSLHISAGKQGNCIVVACSNTGESIPNEDVANIFKQFYRVEKSRSQVYGGSGLGLTIARRIVEMHGGEIAAESAEGITTFTVALPVMKYAA